MSLYFEKETEEEFLSDCDIIAQSVIEETLREHCCPFPCEVSIYLVDEETIKETNNDTRGIDKVTDVLSFPNVTWDQIGDFSMLSQEKKHFTYFNPENDELILGEMMICQKRVNEQALEYGHSVKREFAFLVAHSMLHLLGYDHMDDEERKIMEDKQRDILNVLGIKRTTDKE